jgi:hypothetical protein
MSPHTIIALIEELDKIAASSGGWGQQNMGYKTTYESSGVQTPQEMRKAMPKLQGTKGVSSGVRNQKRPPLRGSRTNLHGLQRRHKRLSNIELQAE